VFAVAAILTAGAVLRAAARISFGWGPSDEEDEFGEKSEEPETRRGHALPPAMWAPAAIVLVLALVLGAFGSFDRAVRVSALRFQDGSAYGVRVLDETDTAVRALAPSAVDGAGWARPILVIALSCAVAFMALFRACIPECLRRAAAATLLGPLRRFRELQSGRVGDYVTWLVVGVACFGALSAMLLR
jgi:multicomponent Na+:H+ antiporter subunit D